MSANEGLFLSLKFKTTRLKDVVTDVQLQDHYRTETDLYQANCHCCKHTHNDQQCLITTSDQCEKCGAPSNLIITGKELMFHSLALEKASLRVCCTHIHNPPCNNCLACSTGKECVIAEPFECNFLTTVQCRHHPRKLCRSVNVIGSIQAHLFDARKPAFYFCSAHAHRHQRVPDIECTIQKEACCSAAVALLDYPKSFTLHEVDENGKLGRPMVIYSPLVWRDLSTNCALTMFRTAILPKTSYPLVERYKKFKDANFKIPQMKKFCSGKESVVKTKIIGYPTEGTYQTGGIACDLDEKTILCPQKLWNKLQHENFDTDMVAVKRDPAINQTCLFICSMKENPDPTVDIIMTSDGIAKGMNQDQDGDRLANYILTSKESGWFKKNNYDYMAAKLEMKAAQKSRLTMDGQPRYHVSPSNLVLMATRPELFAHDEFFQRVAGKKPKFIDEAGCAYLVKPFRKFRKLALNLNRADSHLPYSVDDLLDNNYQDLEKIIASGAKGNKTSIQTVMDGCKTDTSLGDKFPDMVNQMNRYILSGQDLSKTGRKQFVMLYCLLDVLLGPTNFLFFNNVPVADYNRFGGCGALNFNQSSLELFLDDLKNINLNQTDLPKENKRKLETRDVYCVKKNKTN